MQRAPQESLTVVRTSIILVHLVSYLLNNWGKPAQVPVSGAYSPPNIEMIPCFLQKDVNHHLQNGEHRFIGEPQLNTIYLPRTGISPRITRTVVNNTTKTVYVQMAADVSPLFPRFLQVNPIWVAQHLPGNKLSHQS
jgi:hypothetical protein